MTSDNPPDGEPHVLVEAEISEGVTSAPHSKYHSYHPRICRPVGLTPEDCKTVCNYAVARIGCDDDLRNITDLMRYLFPLPVPQRWRRRMIALGSDNPTRMICSALIAQSFEAVRYPILPKMTLFESKAARRELLEIRNSSLYTPRDFDISPYFMVIKPTLAETFDYKRMDWVDLQVQCPARTNATSDGTDTMFQESQASDGLSGRCRALRQSPRGEPNPIHSRVVRRARNCRFGRSRDLSRVCEAFAPASTAKLAGAGPCPSSRLGAGRRGTAANRQLRLCPAAPDPRAVR